MSSVTTGDLSQTFVLRNRNTALKSQLTRLAQEMTTGQTAAPREHLNGSYAFLARIEHSLTMLDARRTAVDEARLTSGAMQAALEALQDNSTELGSSLLTAGTSTTPAIWLAASRDAEGRFGDMVSALNRSVGGRALFAGVRTDSAAMIAGDELLGALSGAVAAAGAVSLGDVAAVLDDWFDSPGGGYETDAYLGATRASAPVPLDEGVEVSLDIRADDPEFRALLKSVALAALAADDSLGLAPAVQREMIRSAGEQMLTSQDSLTRLRADLGYTEARIEESQSRIAAERSTSLQARNSLLEVDPYEAATELESVQFRLESLYAVTVRLSRLSLAEFMR